MRSGVEIGLVGAMAGLAALAWSGGEPGASAAALALRTADVTSLSPPALLARVLAPRIGLDAALVVVSVFVFALSTAVLWSVLRKRSCGWLPAAAGLIVGSATPLLLRTLGLGLPDLTATGFVAAGVAALSERRLLAGLGWSALVATLDARMGGTTAIAGAIAGGGAWAALGGVALFGAPARALADATGGLQFAAAAAAAAALPGRWRRSLVAAAVLSLGTFFSLSGVPVPLPAYFLALFAPDGSWAPAAVVAGGAAALAVAQFPVRAASAVAVLALFEGVVRVGMPPAGGSVAAPLAVASIAERSGSLLDLPFEVEGLPCAAPGGTNLVWEWYARLHGRPRLVDSAPVPKHHPAFGEPSVVAALNLRCGSRFLVPPGLPAVTLGALGVTELAVHRGRYPAAALAVIDPVFARQYGPPIRDHAGAVDLYRVQTSTPGLATPGRLRLEGDPAAESWQSLESFLQGVMPPAAKPTQPR